MALLFQPFPPTPPTVSAPSPAPASVQAVRQRFVPVEGLADKTSWGVENHSDFNPDGWAVSANMTLGGVARIQPWMIAHSPQPAQQSPADDVCHIKLVAGNDDAVTLSVEDLKANNTMTVDLKRDQWTDITVNGVRYRIGYCSVWVAPDKPDTTPYACIMLTESAAREPSSSAAAPQPDSLSFGPVQTAILNGSDKSFLNLDTGATFPVYTGRAADLEHWKQMNGIDLSIKSDKAGMGVSGPIIMGEIADDRWATMSPGELIHVSDTNMDVGNLATNVFLSVSHTYTFLTRGLNFGIMQVRSVAGNPREIALAYKIIQVPVTFGPVVERVIDMNGDKERALNLGSQSYVVPPSQSDEQEFFSSTNDLRNAGVDLYGAGSMDIRVMDMRFWDDSNTEEKDAPPAIPNPWADVNHFPPFLYWVTKHPLSSMDTNSPDYLMFSGILASDQARRRQPHEDLLHGTRVCTFATRDGVAGILQIAKYENDGSGHYRAVIRYRLVQK